MVKQGQVQFITVTRLPKFRRYPALSDKIRGKRELQTRYHQFLIFNRGGERQLKIRVEV
jgi:hypothetical protein